MPSLPPLDFALPVALAGLLLLIPVIVLYLLKPKPKHIRFPSVMFILRAEKSKRLRTFFKKIVRDPLLLLQILVIALLVSAVAQPFLTSKQEENPVENAVIVFDSSASMQASDVSPDRITRAKQLAGDILNKMNEESVVSIVLAENVPIILAKDLKRDEAKQAVEAVFASDSPTNLGDAVLFSRNLLAEDAARKKIYVLSDFAQMEGADIGLVGKIIEQSNASISFVKVNGEGQNMGIIEMNAKRFTTDRNRFSLTFTVGNYMDDLKEVDADVLVDDRVVATLNGSVGAHGQKFYSYEGAITQDAHRITVALKGSDVFSVDDKAYAFLPAVKKYKVLLITDENADQYLKYALQSSKDVDLAPPAILPVLPEFSGYDVIIVGEINKQYIIPTMFSDLEKYANAGGHVIFVASEALNGTRNDNLAEILPVRPPESVAKPANGEKISIAIEHEILTDIVVKGSTYFPNIVAYKYLVSTPVNDSVVIVNAGDSPIIAYKTQGKGKIAFMGINSNPTWSNFYYSSSFPVFWMQLIAWVTRDESILGVNNFRTGEYLPIIRDAVITSPSGQILNATNLMLDETGFYELSGGGQNNTLAVSLLNDRESDIARTVKVNAVSDKDFHVVTVSLDVKQYLIPYLLVLVLLLLFVEVYYYKRREMV